MLHADIERVNLAMGVEHGAVGAEEFDVKVAVDERWVQGSQHGQALEGLSIAELRLEGHPRTVAEKAVKGG